MEGRSPGYGSKVAKTLHELETQDWANAVAPYADA
jgi:hypothetical protein